MHTVEQQKDSVTYNTHKCTKCWEEILDMQQLKRLAQQYKELRKAKEITFATWGNSLAVRIPKEYVDKYKLTHGKQGLLLKEKEGMRIVFE